jgi:hypothetical protein
MPQAPLAELVVLVAVLLVLEHHQVLAVSFFTINS